MKWFAFKIVVAIVILIAFTVMIDITNTVTSHIAVSAAIDQLENPSIQNTVKQKLINDAASATYFRWGFVLFLVTWFFSEIVFVTRFIYAQIVELFNL